MSSMTSLHPEFAKRRAEVEVDDTVIWIRVDDDTVAINMTHDLASQLQDALKVVGPRLPVEVAA